MLIRLNISLKHAEISLRLDKQVGENAAPHYYRLDEPQARLYYVQPDEKHLTMLKENLALQGSMFFPFHCYESFDNVNTGPSAVFDVSPSMSLIEWSYITWVNHGSDEMFDDESNEIVYAGGPEISGSGAWFCPPLKELYMSVSGKDFPSVDGLNNATLTEIRRYTE